ncbi:substrate-binding periplasmic protein [Aliiruegeria sabulilitoris]|uniref:substrate-binding periplasmic protein n=1 Tax=Aliiruegeria sabulilitoris TaxID=1510458 RepID=UPI0018D20FCE|nr:transporter substrate-binding domain-containing protein [Aliiruegeria sabulilitoris]
MTRKSAFAKVAMTALLFGGGIAQADTIELRGDQWCPFNCQPGSERPGFMVEIAREALALYGHTVNYEIMNWARSLEYVHSGRINGVIGTDKDESPDLVFGPPIGTYQEAVAFRAGEARQIDSTETIEGQRVGAIKGYEYISVIADYMDQNSSSSELVQTLSGDTALEQNLRKLLARRVDLVPEERSVLAYTLSTLSITSDVEIALDPEISDLFIAFSPELENSETYATQLASGLEQLRASGRVAEIMSLYGLSE